jgi:hypothetical protein
MNDLNAFMRMTWSIDALCGEYTEDIWFSSDKSCIDQAKKICNECEVKIQCLNYAINTKQSCGIWGGKNFSEMKWARSKFRKAGGEFIRNNLNWPNEQLARFLDISLGSVAKFRERVENAAR